MTAFVTISAPASGELRTRVEGAEQGRDALRRMGEVGVHDHHPVEAGETDAEQDGAREVPRRLAAHVQAHRRAACERRDHILGAVAGIVVDEKQLPLRPVPGQCAPHPLDERAQTRRLPERRDHDGDRRRERGGRLDRQGDGEVAATRAERRDAHGFRSTPRVSTSGRRIWQERPGGLTSGALCRAGGITAGARATPQAGVIAIRVSMTIALATSRPTTTAAAGRCSRSRRSTLAPGPVNRAAPSPHRGRARRASPRRGRAPPRSTRSKPSTP